MYQILSKTKQVFNGEPFYLCGSYFQHNGKRLHRAVWEYYNGEIKNGFHIHHKDGDTSNNSIDNLEMLIEKEHLSLHSSTEEAKERSRAIIEKIRPLTNAWHHSENGKENGRINAHFLHDHEPITVVCKHCGKPFKTMDLRKSTSFCSNACKSASRRESGVDNETRICPICENAFEVNKYEHQLYCSRKCAWEARSKRNSLRYI